MCLVGNGLEACYEPISQRREEREGGGKEEVGEEGERMRGEGGELETEASNC